jgi:glycosyltransferase involved in cell wall biosynthesis
VSAGTGQAARAADRPLRVLALRSIDGRGGGADVLLLRTASRLNGERVRMTVCGIYRSGDEDYDLDRRAADLGIDYHGIAQTSLLARGVLPAIRRLVHQCRPDLVDAQDYKAAWFAARLARLEGILPIATLHGWSGHHWRERLLYYPAEKLLVRSFPLAIAVSAEIAGTLRRWGCAPDRVEVLPNGVDPQELRRTPGTAARVRRHLGIPPGDIVLGAVGRLEREKRFDLLLQSMARLLPRRRELRLLLVGEGSLRPRLQEQARRLGIDHRCRFLGHRRDVAELYQACDVLVQSSDHEGTPTVLLEAMALKVPVVATDVGGTGQLIEHGRHGLLVPRRDARALAAAVEHTLSGWESTVRRVAAARRRIEDELSLDARTRRLEFLYAQVARRCGGRGAQRTARPS